MDIPRRTRSGRSRPTPRCCRRSRGLAGAGCPVSTLPRREGHPRARPGLRTPRRPPATRLPRPADPPASPREARPGQGPFRNDSGHRWPAPAVAAECSPTRWRVGAGPVKPPSTSAVSARLPEVWSSLTAPAGSFHPARQDRRRARDRPRPVHGRRLRAGSRSRRTRPMPCGAVPPPGATRHVRGDGGESRRTFGGSETNSGRLRSVAGTSRGARPLPASPAHW
ncbi:Uncharacterised protein [Mycobacterium tuberculosis]|nr:Uncharacterised protein [Mycobacterium tuberculosis]CKR42964.1 Uncharacterised protein [Mycobacterium tuberculosis]CKS44254.1 Uncharacterised protein [Mycobacterium tuberculosis]CKS47537.1 Uncharacterised protein [Mycobacterium tuberculosis]CKT00413.1 Uncharacterised protein [Mycobacterium tuberculosis]